MPHRGGGDRSLCQSYDDSQSGLGFTSNLLNWLENSYCFFFLSQLCADPVVKIHQQLCKEDLEIYKLITLEK